MSRAARRHRPPNLLVAASQHVVRSPSVIFMQTEACCAPCRHTGKPGPDLPFVPVETPCHFGRRTVRCRGCFGSLLISREGVLIHVPVHQHRCVIDPGHAQSRGPHGRTEPPFAAADARRKLVIWRYDCNNARPHSSLATRPRLKHTGRLSKLRAPRPARLPNPKATTIKPKGNSL